MITLSFERDRQLIIAEMSGFLSIDEVMEFSRDEQALVEKMGLKSGEFYLLIDTAETVIQSQEVVAAFQTLITDSRYKAKRIAVARKGSLTRMQTTRILMLRDNAAIFETRDEAENWLFAQ